MASLCHLTEILRDLLKTGYLITREDVAALSPYMTSHIKRFGDYLIDMETVPKMLDEVGFFALAWSVKGKDGRFAVFNLNTPDVCGALGCLYTGYWLRKDKPLTP